MKKQPPNTASLQRRRFISDTVKLALLSTIITPLTQACNNNKSKSGGSIQPDSTNKNKKSSSSKRKRQKWSHESLVLNSKTGVMHFPTSKVYHYYDEIKSNHLQAISIGAWASQLQNKVHLNRGQSGNILELLSLNHLTQGVNDEYLNAATDTLATAFTDACNNSKDINLNEKNFRLHELMLQLITLNTSIPAEQKWQSFNSKIKKPSSLRKRQSWMASEAAFNERVKYILDYQTDYMNRLNERAKKYSFT